MPGSPSTTNSIPYDQRIARALVVPLARLGVTPNQVTAFSLLPALVAAARVALGPFPFSSIRPRAVRRGT